MLAFHTADDDRLSSSKAVMRQAQSIPFALILFLGLSLSPAANATDGVAEINHTCAVQTGCFPGDTAGYPVTIDGQAGASYRLTSDLIIPDENTSGIVVNADGQGIDLNNFAIIRSACVGVTINCTPTSGGGAGIRGVTRKGNSVKNGRIIGMGDHGIILSEESEITGLWVRWSRRNGIHAGRGSTVSGNRVHENGVDGIFSFGGSTISGNTVSNNGGDGIQVESGSIVSGNTVNNNGDEGIETVSDSSVLGNASYSNGGNGIQVVFGCNVQGNTIGGNSASGLNINSGSAFKDNVITGNTLGQVLGLGSGNGRGGNYCAGPGTGSSFCP